jgi:hypothetical protein
MDATQMLYEFKVGYDAIAGLQAPGYNEREISTFLTKGQEQVFYDILNPAPSEKGVEETEKKRIDLSEYVRDAVCTMSANQTGTNMWGTFFDLPTDFFYTLQENAWSSKPDCKNSANVYVEFDGATMNITTAHFAVGEQVTSGSTIYTIERGSGRTYFMTLVSGNAFSVGDTVTGSTSGATGVISKIGVITEELVVRPITHDQYTINYFNPFKKPYDELCWRIDFSKEVALGTYPRRHEIITDGTYTIEEYSVRYYKRPPPIIVPIPIVYPPFSIDGVLVPAGFAGQDCVLDAGVHKQIIDKAVRLAVAALQETNSYQVKAVEATQSE